ncbi:hypothetical protein GQ600_15892 [Phytophthora cactorum]|nr:hypothetical protein GQ600_15892 [Phytophthora cactorum]
MPAWPGDYITKKADWRTRNFVWNSSFAKPDGTGRPIVSAWFGADQEYPRIEERDGAELRKALRSRNGLITRWLPDGLSCEFEVLARGPFEQAKGGERQHGAAWCSRPLESCTSNKSYREIVKATSRCGRNIGHSFPRRR